MIHGHGDEYGNELLANFSSNIWYDADNKDLYTHLASLLPSTTRYPETNAASLMEAIVQKNAVKCSEIVVCNGSTEAIYLVAHVYAGSVSLIVSPTFSEYADACRLHRHSVYLSAREELVHSIETIQPDIVWICNPNNPDGHCYSSQTIRRLIATYPHTVFVIDQAYKDFCLHETIKANEINTYPNLILLQSLTKRYGIPGLRLGYLLSNEEIVAKINRFRIPWSVNTLAIAAGKYILETPRACLPLEAWLEDTRQLQHDINALSNFRVCPSETPYFLIKLLRGKAMELKAFLQKDKLLVRDATNFEGLEGEYIRVISLTADKNKLLISKLEAWNCNITA